MAQRLTCAHGVPLPDDCPHCQLGRRIYAPRCSFCGDQDIDLTDRPGWVGSLICYPCLIENYRAEVWI